MSRAAALSCDGSAIRTGLVRGLFGAGLVFTACGIEPPSKAEPYGAAGVPDAGGSGGSGGTEADGSGGAAGTFMVDIDASGGFGGRDASADVPLDSCTTIHQRASIVERPMDIIFVIDNSGSMTEEIAQVKARINEDLAAVLAASGIDYRVIMFTNYGLTGLEVCVRAPLGPGDCLTRDAGTAIDNPPRFFHYDWDVQSTDSLCLLLSRWNSPDVQARAPWSSYLRVGSFKTFVEITDDGVSCRTPAGAQLTDATGEPAAQQAIRSFDAELRSLSRDQFGPAGKRTYQWFSIVGLPPHSPTTEPWGPSEPLQTTICSSAQRPGLAYQLLSNETGALRWPVCQNDDFGPMFRAIATSVVEKARLACEWALPPPPPGKVYDSTKLSLKFTNGSGSETNLPRVDSGTGCGDGWFLDNNEAPRLLSLCPATCEAIRADTNASMDIVVPCESIIDPPH
jgi:hypothetical protein